VAGDGLPIEEVQAKLADEMRASPGNARSHGSISRNCQGRVRRPAGFIPFKIERATPSTPLAERGLDDIAQTHESQRTRIATWQASDKNRPAVWVLACERLDARSTSSPRS